MSRISAIFFARFLPQEGTSIIHQCPKGCIIPDPAVSQPSLFDFDDVSEFIIPRPAFWNRYITIEVPSGEYRILGYPVCIKDEKYERNEFIFNFCIVLSTKFSMLPYEAVIRRLASTFAEMELQNQFLSQEGGGGQSKERRSILALIEIVMEDLNNYGECMIPVDDANTINMKLFPSHPNPAPVKSWYCPLAKIKFASIVDDTWDITMLKIIPFIDGINDVRRIAVLADVSLELTKIAIEHLLYYDAIMMLDFFWFSNIYACLPDIDNLIEDPTMQEECINYVTASERKISGYELCRYFTTLIQGRGLKEWIQMHGGVKFLTMVDVRRLIQFGVIKGLIYRIHRYAVSAQYLAGLVTGESSIKDGGDPLQKYTDGCHPFDQIIVEHNMPDAKVLKKISKLPNGDVHILYR